MSDSRETVLTKALELRVRLYERELDRLRRLNDGVTTDEALSVTRCLREAIELTRCLRRLVAESAPDQIHRAFGAPGDFGYEHPIGDALAVVYGVRSEPWTEELRDAGTQKSDSP
jgi:hypothetical protein